MTCDIQNCLFSVRRLLFRFLVYELFYQKSNVGGRKKEKKKKKVLFQQFFSLDLKFLMSEDKKKKKKKKIMFEYFHFSIFIIII